MSAIEVSAKKGKDGEPTSVMYDFGDNLAEMTKLFGEDVVYNEAKKQMIVGLQAGIRRCIETGRVATDFAAKWKPGEKTAGVAVDPLKAALAALAGMDPEEKEQFLKDARAAIKSTK